MTLGPPIVCGLCFGLGVTGVAASWGGRWRSSTIQRADADRTAPADGAAPTSRGARASGAARAATRVPRIAMAGATGALALLFTGWPVALVLGAMAAYGVPTLFRRTAGSAAISKIEAIATWTEMLQGTLAASSGLGEAIMATSALSPSGIRDSTVRLSARLGSGMHPTDALARFADELDDPSADRVACALILASSSRAQRLGDLLAALADSTREEVALRLRIETSRASVRSSVRIVLVFSIAFAVALTLLGRHYMAPFGTGTGQLVLMVVGALYAAGLTLMATLARPPAPVRLMGAGVASQ